MNNKCMKWRDQLLEAALTPQPKQNRRALGTLALAETADGELRDHLSQCPACTEELEALRARRQRMDSLLPRVVGEAEPSPGLRARILAAAEAASVQPRSAPWRLWALAASAVVIIAVMISLPLNRSRELSADDARMAQALAQWHAPTDIFLQSPSQDILKTVPKLGESYMEIPMKYSTRRK